MIPCLVPTLLLTIALPHFCEGGSIDANYAESSSQSFKTSCWLCEVPKCKECLTSQWTQWSSRPSPCGKKDTSGSCTRVIEGMAAMQQVLSTMEGHRINGFAPQCPLTHIGDCCETGLFVCVEM